MGLNPSMSGSPASALGDLGNECEVVWLVLSVPWTWSGWCEKVVTNAQEEEHCGPVQGEAAQLPQPSLHPEHTPIWTWNQGVAGNGSGWVLGKQGGSAIFLSPLPTRRLTRLWLMQVEIGLASDLRPPGATQPLPFLPTQRALSAISSLTSPGLS